jgi:hypothetical protein
MGTPPKIWFIKRWFFEPFFVVMISFSWEMKAHSGTEIKPVFRFIVESGRQ